MGHQNKFNHIQQNQAPIAIIGLGVTGLSVLKFCLSHLHQSLYLLNDGDIEKTKSRVVKYLEQHNIEAYQDRLKYLPLNDSIQEEHIVDCLNESQFIMRSPGVDPRHAICKNYIDQFISKEIGEIELSFYFLKYKEFELNQTRGEAFKIISLTGTNGKTTSVYLLQHLLDQLGEKNYLGGNVGFPFIDLFSSEIYHSFFGKETIYIVLELSSFQTEQLNHFSSDVISILNISPSHEERYKNYSEYFTAKEVLLSFLSEDGKTIIDKMVYDQLKETTKKIIKEQVVLIDRHDQKCMEQFENEYLGEFNLIGEHNIRNAYFGYKILQNLNLKLEKRHFANFKGVSFRLEKRFAKNGHVFFNDAKSTNQIATITAVGAMNRTYESFDLIMGGQKRSATIDFNEVFKIMTKTRTLYLYGESADDLAQIANKEKVVYQTFQTIEELMLELSKRDERQLPVLFSPGFPSFDQFKNYIERGNVFNELINKYF